MEMAVARAELIQTGSAQLGSTRSATIREIWEAVVEIPDRKMEKPHLTVHNGPLELTATRCSEFKAADFKGD